MTGPQRSAPLGAPSLGTIAAPVRREPPGAESTWTRAETDADLQGSFFLFWRLQHLATRCPLCLTEALDSRCKAYWTCRAYADACGVDKEEA